MILRNNPISQEIYNNIPLRGWVTNIPNPDLEIMALSLINKLSYLQAKKKIMEPKKVFFHLIIQFKKRLAAGFNEVKRSIQTTL